MSRRRKLQLLVSVVIILLAISLVLYFPFSPTRLRRTWTRQAVAEITALSSDPTLIQRETAAIATQPSTLPQPPWVGDHVALMRNGQWVVFKNECVHQHQLLGDVFIAKASDSHWYHSTFHFCCEMLVTHMDPQPPDLQTFITNYSLRPFDGNPDSPDAIEPTWTPGSSPIH